MSELRRCAACGRLQAYAAPVCRTCSGAEFIPCVLPCPATVWSWTTVFRPPTAALADRAPYTVVLAQGADGGFVLAAWTDAPPPAIGAAIVLEEVERITMARPA